MDPEINFNPSPLVLLLIYGCLCFCLILFLFMVIWLLLFIIWRDQNAIPLNSWSLIHPENTRDWWWLFLNTLITLITMWMLFNPIPSLMNNLLYLEVMHFLHFDRFNLTFSATMHYSIGNPDYYVSVPVFLQLPLQWTLRFLFFTNNFVHRFEVRFNSIYENEESKHATQKYYVYI